MKCESCGTESIHPLCKKCYAKTKKPASKEFKINDNSIKGKLAEAIVEEMFISMGYRVFRFGMESTVPGFGRRHIPLKGEVAEQIRKMPDFIIVKDDKTAFVEVKYRTNGKFDFNKHYKKRGGYPYKNAYFILVSPRAILIQKASELEKDEDFKLLTAFKDFENDRNISYNTSTTAKNSSETAEPCLLWDGVILQRSRRFGCPR